MPRSRLSAFITRCPIDPATQAISDMASAWPYPNGVMNENSAPTTQAITMPTPQLAQLKLPLTLGANGSRASHCRTVARKRRRSNRWPSTGAASASGGR